MANANKTAALKQRDVRLIQDPVARHLYRSVVEAP